MASLFREHPGGKADLTTRIIGATGSSMVAMLAVRCEHENRPQSVSDSDEDSVPRSQRASEVRCMHWLCSSPAEFPPPPRFDRAQDRVRHGGRFFTPCSVQCGASAGRTCLQRVLRTARHILYCCVIVQRSRWMQKRSRMLGKRISGGRAAPLAVSLVAASYPLFVIVSRFAARS